MKLISSLTVILLVVFWSCSKSNDSESVPKITYSGVTKTSLIQGALNEDSLWLNFELEDSDGDIGFGSNSANRDIIVRDLRTGLIMDEFKIPDLPSTDGQKITAKISVLIFTTCCIFPNSIPPCSAPPEFPTDTINFEIKVVDKKGHQSNLIVSEAIVLRCI
ncbi:MAG TPA: hypothetical protein PK622_06465 [Saprospiraceae bacterium]|nr:hypothetical protein [Saprospiraceae bacterium]HUN16433.1 hypothetical protein [Saprospiraceae bacterium]